MLRQNASFDRPNGLNANARLYFLLACPVARFHGMTTGVVILAPWVVAAIIGGVIMLSDTGPER